MAMAKGAETIAFMASEAARYVTGGRLAADGGVVMPSSGLSRAARAGSRPPAGRCCLTVDACGRAGSSTSAGGRFGPVWWHAEMTAVCTWSVTPRTCERNCARR